MIVLGIIVLVVALIAFLKVGIQVTWDGTLALRLMIGPVRFSILSDKNTEESSAKEPVQKETAAKKKSRPQKKKSPWPGVLLANWQELLELVGRVLHMPCLNPLILKVGFGGEDPAACAVNYGRAWALVGAVMPLLERNFRIGKREIDVRYDQDSKKMSVYAKAALTVRVGQCVSLAVSALMLFLRLYKQTKQSEKAVQVK